LKNTSKCEKVQTRNSKPPSIDDKLNNLLEQNVLILDKLTSLEKSNLENTNRINTVMNSLQTMKDELNGVISSQSLINEKFEEQKTKMEKMTKSADTLSNNHKILEARTDHLKEKLKITEDKLDKSNEKINDLEQYGRRMMVTISGVPRKPQESTDKIILRIAELLEVKMSLYDVEVSHRVSGKMFAPIIVKFNSRRIRNEFWNAKRNLRTITTDYLGFKESNHIYMNESLTERNGSIFKSAWDQLKKTGLYKHVFTTNGITYAKKDFQSEKLLIRYHSDILNLLPSA